MASLHPSHGGFHVLWVPLHWLHLQNIQLIYVLCKPELGIKGSGRGSFPHFSSLAVFIRSVQIQVEKTWVTWRPQKKSQEWAIISNHKVPPYSYRYPTTCYCYLCQSSAVLCNTQCHPISLYLQFIEGMNQKSHLKRRRCFSVVFYPREASDQALPLCARRSDLSFPIVRMSKTKQEFLLIHPCYIHC